MKEENIIKTIELDIEGNGEFIKVTPERLLKIHAAIGDLLNLKTEKITEREIIRDTYVPYSQPIWYWNPNRSPYYGTISVTNNGTGEVDVGNTISNSSNLSDITTKEIDRALVTYTSGTVRLTI